VVEPHWLGARAAGVPVHLGDALEDGGCADQAIMRHCRSNVQHVRGCWVVDCLLDNP
jgi:hypothetical protein